MAGGRARSTGGAICLAGLALPVAGCARRACPRVPRHRQRRRNAAPRAALRPGRVRQQFRAPGGSHGEMSGRRRRTWEPRVEARRPQMTRARAVPGVVLVAFGLFLWPASAPRAQRQPPHEHGPAAPAGQTPPPPGDASALAFLRQQFDQLASTSPGPGARKVGGERRAKMFEEFLAWPGNPFEVELTVRLTSASGVGQIIGTLAVKNSEIAVAGRKEAALFIKPNLRGLGPGLYAFHVHENPTCGPAIKDGQLVPGLAAGNHLWLSGTGVLSGTTFNSHLGDLPNLVVDADGTATKPVVAARLSLADVVKRSFIVHASRDDNSARLACAALN